MYNLDALVAQITDVNTHKEVDTGDAVGNEIW
jgi:antitoxin component of MazEF toxin-antitoxin module